MNRHRTDRDPHGGVSIRRALYPVLVINFVGTLGFSVVLPFLVFLVERLGGNAFVYAIMGATYSLFQLLGSPVLGAWSDRFGRRRILLLSQVGTFLSWGTFLIALWLPVRAWLEVNSPVLGSFTLTLPLIMLLFARALDGVTGGNVSVANAYLADISTDRNRSAHFGKMALASNLGFVLGPALAGALGAAGSGELLPVVAAFAISAFAIVLIVVWLPETAPGAQRTEPEPKSVRRIFGQEQKPCVRLQRPVRLTWDTFRTLPSVPLLLVLYFLVFLAFNLFYVSFPVYAATGLRWSLAQTGLFFGVTSLLMALVQGPLLEWAAKRWPERILVLVGSAVLAVSFPFFAARGYAAIYTGAALLALGNGLMWPSLLAILAKASGQALQGAIQGLAGSVSAVASILGMVTAGVLYARYGSAMFWLSALLTMLTFVLAFAIPRAVRQRPDAGRRKGRVGML